MKKFKKYLLFVLCAAIAAGPFFPLAGRTAAAGYKVITSFEEADTVKELSEQGVIGYSGNISVNTDAQYVSDGKNSLCYLPKSTVQMDYDTYISVKFDSRISEAYGITFKVLNRDAEKSASIRCFLDSANGNYQYIVSAAADGSWHTVTVDFSNIGLRTGDYFNGNSSEGAAVPYDEILTLDRLMIRIPFIGSEHAGVYFDDFRYITEEEAEDITTLEKTLVTFDECQTGTEFTAPDGFTVLEDTKAYDGTASVTENPDGSKMYSVAFDKAVGSSTASTVSGRPKYIALSVDIPKKYAKYLDAVNVEIKSDKSPPANVRERMYYLIGITDGTKYGKTVTGANELEYDAEGVISENTVGMLRVARSAFLGKSSSSADKWTYRHMAEATKLLIYITIPTCDGTEGWSVSIGDISVTLKGGRSVLEAIDAVDPYLVSFDEYDDLDRLLSLNTFKTDAGAGSFEISSDSVSSPNALLFKGGKDSGNDYSASIRINLDERVSESAGIQFYAKNLDAAAGAQLRCFMVQSSGSVKYQYITTIDPGKEGYTRVRIFFDDIGLKTGDEFWGGTTMGSVMTEDEISDIAYLRIRIPNVYKGSGGVLFDSFELIVTDDRDKMLVRMLDFEDCKAGGQLPENVEIGGNYKGSSGVVQNADNSKAYQINFDAAAEFSTSNQISGHDYFLLKLSLPESVMTGAVELRVGLTNNAVSCDNSWSNAENIYHSIAIGGGGYYGKKEENASKFPDVGQTVEVRQQLKEMRLLTSQSAILGWSGTAARWDEEQLGMINTIMIYITAPTCEGNEGWNVQINYIDVYYSDVPQNYETQTRQIVKANRFKPGGGYITAQETKINRNDPDYKLFTTAWRLETDASAEVSPAVFENVFTNYCSDLTPFIDTATLGFYLKSDKPLLVELTLTDSTGNSLPVSVETEPPEDGSYGAYQLSFADIYSGFLADNPDAVFDYSDIRSISVLPVSHDGQPVGEIMLSGLSVWSKEVGSAVIYSGYHYEDKDVAVDAYNDALDMSTVTVIESEDPLSAVKSWGIDFGAEAQPLAFKTITLYSAAGDVIEPNGKIWLSFKVDPTLDFSEIFLYRVYFDGSFIKERYVVEDGYISLNTFMTGTFAVVKGGTEEPEEAIENSGGNSFVVNTDNIYTQQTNGAEQENGDSGEPQRVIKRQIIEEIVRRKKKSTSGLQAWQIVLIAAGSVLAAGGAVTAVILVRRSKRRRGTK